MITNKRIYYTEDKRLVTEDHPDAFCLAYPKGATIDDKTAKTIIDQQEADLTKAPNNKQLKGKTKEQGRD